MFQEGEARTRDLTDSLEQQTVTGEFLKAVNRSTFDLQAVLQSLVQSATRLCDADIGLIFRREGDEYRVAADSGLEEGFGALVRQHPIRSGPETLVGRSAMTCGAVHIPDVLADREYHWPEAQRAGAYRTGLAVPLLKEGNPIGIIVLSRYVVQPLIKRTSETVLWKGVDAGLIDGAVNGAGTTVRGAASLLRLLQTGSVRAYAAWIFVGVLLILAFYLVR